MRITEIQIDRFGVWQDLRLSLDRTGLHVVYGPNEAGKTTVLRFLRGVLYGFAACPGDSRWESGSSPGFRSDVPGWSGALQIAHGERPCEIRRASQHGGRGLVAVSGLDGDAPPDERLRELLGNTEETVFQNVFALGLQELQELATLHEDEVARHVYGMTLGPKGRKLLEVFADLEDRRHRLLPADPTEPGYRGEGAAERETEGSPASTDEAGSPPGIADRRPAGELAALLQRDAELAAELAALGDLRDRHAALSGERAGVEERIAALKERQADLQSQIRQYHFLERVWSPWNQVQECRAELDRIPQVAGFPENGTERLDRFEEEIDSLARCREAVLSEAAQFRKEADALGGDPQFRQHAATMQSFVDQREWLAELHERIKESEARRTGLRTALEEKLEPLGADWPASRLSAVDTSASAHYRLTGAARNYRIALSRRGRFRRRYQALADACHQKQIALEERLRELGIDSLDDALANAKARREALEEMGRLRRQEAEIEQGLAGIREQLERLEMRLAFPKWVTGLLACFGGIGIVFVLLGLVTGTSSSLLSGLAYTFVGATCGLSAWGLKSHFGKAVRETIGGLEEEQRQHEARLSDTRAEIARLAGAGEGSRLLAAADSSEGAVDGSPAAGQDGGSPTAPDEPEPPSDEVLTEPRGHSSSADAASVSSEAQAAQAAPLETSPLHLAELEALAESERKLRETRRRLAELRSRFRGLQRDVGTARQNWCEMLTRVGLAETVRIAEAFETWQRIAEAAETKRLYEAAESELQGRRQIFQSYRQRIDELARRVGSAEHEDPLGLLAAWDAELQTVARNRAERHRLLREEKTRRKESEDYQARIDDLKIERSALLVQGGAAGREEFEQRAEWVRRRGEFEELLAMAQAELSAACETEPELAVVEEDLLGYDAADNAEIVELLNLELDEVAAALQQSFEELGRVKQEIEALENDRRPTRLRCERAQVQARLRRATEKWLALRLASRTLDGMRRDFERTCQPATLAAASGFLERLTRGRYVRVWRPLHECRLMIDDAQHRSFGVEQLSNGTREQLFLAVRLALVRELAGRGVELPVVLDDVLVNFDQDRTEAAVDALREFAEREGAQVLLFTCHRHLAELMESRGAATIRLPAHAASREERLAG